MSTMIYRGVTHTGTTASVSKRPLDLIYRGIPHDGVSRTRPDLPAVVSMCYRGVTHDSTVSGPRHLAARGDRTQSARPAAEAAFA